MYLYCSNTIQSEKECKKVFKAIMTLLTRKSQFSIHMNKAADRWAIPDGTLQHAGVPLLPFEIALLDVRAHMFSFSHYFAV